LLLVSSVLGLAGSRLEAATPAPSPSTGAPWFRPGPQAGAFTFDTGLLRGTLRREGRALGLSEVVHIPTGRRLDRSNGLLSHYRVFTRGVRYGGGAWDWPSTAQLLENGAVQVTWPAADGRPFDLVARYRWHDAASLDVETVVRPKADLRAFESFLACYFDAAFSNCLVSVKPASGGGTAPHLLRARRELGEWLMAPRDDAAAAVIRDGRWKLEPNPVAWTLLPPLARPLALRRDPGSGLTAILLAPPQDCFAVAMPHEAEGHYSLYFSLFGRDLAAGEEAVARTRLVLAVSPTDAQTERQYEAYLREEGAR